MKGLYIHIPFCIKKCAYCDFVSITNSEYMFEKYIDTLLSEAEEYRGEEIDSIFIGGGTPTVLPPILITRLLKGIHNIFRISSNAEISCEGNPGTITDEKISALIDGGINRMSVGVQSFNDKELKVIGRIHDAKTAYNTVCKIRKRGISNINIDIMTALPNQTPKSLNETLKTAVELPITHISAYSLIIEDGTPLEKDYSKGLIAVPDEDEDREMYADTVEFLKKFGFNRYEISNFAKQGYECRHNLKYWNCDEYIGLGAAAHSYIGEERFFNSNNIKEYIIDNKREKITLSEADKISEFMMMGLRKCSGINIDEFKNRFGKTIDEVFGAELNKFMRLDLLQYHNGSYGLTDRGIDVSNSVMCDFLLS